MRAHVFQIAGHEEGALGQIVHSPVQMALKEAMVSCTLTYLPGTPVNTSPRCMGLGQEALDAARALHGQPVFLGQFVHAQNGDDVLQLA